MNNSGKRYCSECRAEFGPQDEIYSWTDGKSSFYVCCDCFDALFNELSRYEKAALIGSEVQFCGADFALL